MKDTNPMRLWEALASCPALGHIQQMLICAIDGFCFLGNSRPQPEQGLRGPRYQCCLGVGNPSITVVPPQTRGLSTVLQQPQAVARPRSPSHPGNTHPFCPSVFTYHPHHIPSGPAPVRPSDISMFHKLCASVCSSVKWSRNFLPTCWQGAVRAGQAVESWAHGAVPCPLDFASHTYPGAGTETLVGEAQRQSHG